MSTNEMLESLKAKFNFESEYVSRTIHEPTLNRYLLSIAKTPANIGVEISNVIGEEQTEKSISFKVENLEQAIQLIDKYFNLKHSSIKEFVNQFITENSVDIKRDLFILFYLS